jgi:hypothetical protein
MAGKMKIGFQAVCVMGKTGEQTYETLSCHQSLIRRSKANNDDEGKCAAGWVVE